MRQIALRLVLILPFILQILGAVAWVSYFPYRSEQEAINNIASQLRYQAILEANTNLILQLVGKIPKTEIHLAQSLTLLAC